MNDITFRTQLEAGAKGDKGDQGVNYVVPTGGILAIEDSESIPEGYELTSAPELPSGESGEIIYSKTERKVGYWYDGEILYQKTVEVDNIGRNSWAVNSFDIGDANVHTLWGYILTDNGIKWTINYYNSGSYFSVYFNDSGFTLNWYYNNATLAKAVLTIQYTKNESAASS